MIEQIFFYIFAAIAVVSAVSVITARNPVRSVVFLIVCLMQVAAIFILLRSPFLAAVQVFIYVGAVMVLFLFAVMTLGFGAEELKDYIHSQGIPAVALVLLLLAVVGYLVLKGSSAPVAGEFSDAIVLRHTEAVGKALYTRYIFQFEVVALLLLVALVGAIVLVMKEKPRRGGGGGKAGRGLK